MTRYTTRAGALSGTCVLGPETTAVFVLADEAEAELDELRAELTEIYLELDNLKDELRNDMIERDLLV